MPARSTKPTRPAGAGRGGPSGSRPYSRPQAELEEGPRPSKLPKLPAVTSSAKGAATVSPSHRADSQTYAQKSRVWIPVVWKTAEAPAAPPGASNGHYTAARLYSRPQAELEEDPAPPSSPSSPLSRPQRKAPRPSRPPTGQTPRPTPRSPGSGSPSCGRLLRLLRHHRGPATATTRRRGFTAVHRLSSRRTPPSKLPKLPAVTSSAKGAATVSPSHRADSQAYAQKSRVWIPVVWKTAEAPAAPPGASNGHYTAARLYSRPQAELEEGPRPSKLPKLPAVTSSAKGAATVSPSHRADSQTYAQKSRVWIPVVWKTAEAPAAPPGASNGYYTAARTPSTSTSTSNPDAASPTSSPATTSSASVTSPSALSSTPSPAAALSPANAAGGPHSSALNPRCSWLEDLKSPWSSAPPSSLPTATGDDPVDVVLNDLIDYTLGLTTKLTFWDEFLEGGTGVPRTELVQVLKSGFNPKLLEFFGKGELPSLDEVMSWSADEEVPGSYRGVYMKILPAKRNSGKKSLAYVGMSLRHGLKEVWGVGKRGLEHKANLEEGNADHDYFSKRALKDRHAYGEHLVMVPLWGDLNHPTTTPALFVARLAAVITAAEQISAMFLQAFTGSQFRKGWLYRCPTYGQAEWEGTCVSIPFCELPRYSMTDQAMWTGVTKGVVNEQGVLVGDGFGLQQQCHICDGVYIDKKTLKHHIK
ncbi:hypothetical protein IAT38_008072 [Cryptococcus sp. DSM 104549]